MHIPFFKIIEIYKLIPFVPWFSVKGVFANTISIFHILLNYGAGLFLDRLNTFALLLSWGYVKIVWKLWPRSKLSSFRMLMICGEKASLQRLNGEPANRKKGTQTHNGIVTTYV